ncbi:MAG: aminotransferase class I/II-fold pyridoxal phosphate-dependent enzyme [Firmicutes bacterium]|nr:aminotransferase class I/II-fold pyridoxal phosphate-dependent enzyme [Bacillota bacterium]
MIERFNHGGEASRENIKYDFSVNLNPLGMPESVKAILAENQECFESYPDSSCLKLRQAIKESFNSDHNININIERIVCGNGASDLIYRICGAFDFKRALIAVPSFSEYERALKQNGCHIDYWYIGKTGENIDDRIAVDYKKKYTLNSQSQINDINFSDYDAVFLCSPMNPSGALLDREILFRLAAVCEKNNVMLIIDECFIEFVENINKNSMILYINDFSRLMVIRAFTKIFAMAGMRLGYAVFGSGVSAEAVSCFGPPWAVSGPAQLAGAAALKEKEYVRKTVSYVKEQRLYIMKELRKIFEEKSAHWKVFESCVNFILFRAPVKLGRLMEEAGVFLRDCSDYEGLCDEITEQGDIFRYFRMAVKSYKENEVMLDTLKRCVSWL